MSRHGRIRSGAGPGTVVAVLAVLLAAACAGCGPEARHGQPARATRDGGGTARLLLAGDVMLGRGVAARTAADPPGALAGVRDVVRSADLAAANLESPLTLRAHRPGAGPNALEAPPSAAGLLADAGFDVLGVANNHAGDAGPDTVTDTTAALSAASLVAVGGGRDDADAFAARIRTVRGIRVALLAVDGTGAGPRAGAGSPGVARWDDARLRTALRAARRQADVVVVGLHGGTEYRREPDPVQAARAATLAGWGADVVWGHHPHVVQPVTVIDPDGDGRPTVVATSLGNLLFDQHDPATTRGLVLEVLVGRDGVRALRRGQVTIAAGAATFSGWTAPEPHAEAALVRGTWWQLTAAAPPGSPTPLDPADRAGLTARLSPGQVSGTALGDVDGDGVAEAVAAFRRPYRPTLVSRVLPRSQLVDRQGRSAHVGVYRVPGLGQVWVAGSVLRPVGAVAACDGGLAVGITRLDDPTAVVAVGAWRWGGFGFVTYPDLPGPGRPACADVDGDGRRDPLAVERTAS